ncbi:MAG: hypothetical protein ACYCQH_08365 [Acidithiobacillus ferrooxidans]|jgi:hypothetical protein|uniref:hypothetical protein n=1 Tax=Acidithiobacillus ferrooxidans TaxID=920 RepID=UPI000B07BCAF|nr:hypothetical protein [Acidithiobacillus ferrooxidans]MDA8152264.1 hypothetical protein [Acidithiobacillus sp.]MDA8378503.1 hypothetical protein [Planctomycetia bacterium]MBU2858181.1 hypothetical protein [Acidithiobacillus ferrooxidans]MBU2860423.1 hypothetical protein [Acidithiobacillus ferrooxidans]MCR2829402.1 hypothetical protein [Acidithiobacillus ferrooxidans]
MDITSDSLQKTVVLFYAYRDGILMTPTFGVVVKKEERFFAVSVAHAVTDRERFEVWTGVHSDIVKNFDMYTAGKRLVSAASDAVQTAESDDIMAIPLDDYTGDAFDIVVSDIGLLRSALITCLDFAPDDDQILQNVLDGQAGLVEQEDSFHLRLTSQGKAGMSGAPVVVDIGNGKFGLVGLYTGTPRTTPLTITATTEHANVVKIGQFMSTLPI